MQETLKKLLLDRLQSDRIDDAFYEFVKSGRPAAIYGAGRQARIVIDLCNMFGKEYRCLLTSGPSGRWGLLPREEQLPMHHMKNLPENFKSGEIDVITAMGDCFVDEVEELLTERQFPNRYIVRNWNEKNDKLRKLFYDCYLEFHGARLIAGENGIPYIEYPGKNGIFRMCYPEERIFQANTLGELNNIILPSIFGDVSLAEQGPYELPPDVTVQKGDVVFDLGANIGLFSCAAAAKGCSKVYAFEPAVYTAEAMLSRNAALNSCVEVVPFAVGDRDGYVKFYYNDRLDIDADTCRSSIHRDMEPDYRETVVRQVALDSYVKEQGIDRVDYIKSHIEYAENFMLAGAKEILRRYAPKLAFYSQKALGNDRYKEIEKLILEANPAYRIEYRWRRMFACIPK